VNADSSLFLPDFRARERSVQVLMQVAGRSGRGERGGKVIIQTYRPDLECLEAVRKQNFEEFEITELEFRRHQRYPPYCRLSRLIYSHVSEAQTRWEASRRAAEMRSAIRRLGASDVDLIGPAPCYRRRVAGRWRWQIIMRASEPGTLLSQFDWPAGWAIDVDPVTML
jgi:primosomal protein N' (replication factor Y) (superfamily II helicase)